MKDKVNKEKAIDEIVKIIQDFQYNDELSEKYKRELVLRKRLLKINSPTVLICFDKFFIKFRRNWFHF